VHPSPSPGGANFSIMMECTPESGLCHSVCTLGILPKQIRSRKEDKNANTICVEVKCDEDLFLKIKSVPIIKGAELLLLKFKKHSPEQLYAFFFKGKEKGERVNLKICTTI
jgi:hypothetical protein